jgi:hypothetical protein
MCKFAKAGKCSRKDCQFAHGDEELRPSPDFEKTSICPNALREGTCNNPDCRYAHSWAELREIPYLVKTTTCKFYAREGHCSFGAKCRFAHENYRMVSETQMGANMISPSVQVLPETSKPYLSLPNIAKVSAKSSHPRLALKRLNNKKMDKEVCNETSDGETIFDTQDPNRTFADKDGELRRVRERCSYGADRWIAHEDELSVTNAHLRNDQRDASMPSANSTPLDYSLSTQSPPEVSNPCETTHQKRNNKTGEDSAKRTSTRAAAKHLCSEQRNNKIVLNLNEYHLIDESREHQPFSLSSFPASNEQKSISSWERRQDVWRGLRSVPEPQPLSCPAASAPRKVKASSWELCSQGKKSGEIPFQKPTLQMAGYEFEVKNTFIEIIDDRSQSRRRSRSCMW